MSGPTDDDVDDGERTVRVRRRRSRQSWGRRRHLGLITTGLAAVVLVIGLLLVVLTWDDGRPTFAQQVATSQPTASGSILPSTTAPATTTPPTRPASTGTPTAGPTAVRGSITAVGDNQWTVEARGISYTIAITADTTFPKKRAFDSFEVGDGVAVKGTLADGVVTATSVVPTR